MSDTAIKMKLKELINQQNFLLIGFYILLIINISIVGITSIQFMKMNYRIHELEFQNEIKNEVATDYQSYIQLQSDNK